MSLTKAYLTSTKQLSEILDAMKSAQAPERFSTRFLEQLGFKSKNDRLIINVLKGLGFLTDTGSPTQRYYEFLDQTQSDVVLAEGIREAYQDLFRINKRADKLTGPELTGKLKTLLEGKKGEAVIAKMVSTFTALCEIADFETEREQGEGKTVEKEVEADLKEVTKESSTLPKSVPQRVSSIGLSYDIHIHLPASRDQAVYDVLFRSLREHLL